MISRDATDHLGAPYPRTAPVTALSAVMITHRFRECAVGDCITAGMNRLTGKISTLVPIATQPILQMGGLSWR